MFEFIIARSKLRFLDYLVILNSFEYEVKQLVVVVLGYLAFDDV